MSNIFFSSDYHFYDEAFILNKERPFSSVEEMNDTILSNLNKVAKKEDHLFFLGDFSKGHYDIIDHINCKVHLIMGNHDDAIPEWALAKFESVQKLKYLRLAEISNHSQLSNTPKTTYTMDVSGVHSWSQIKIMLCHYPLVSWRARDYGSYMLHGHMHGNYTPPNPLDCIIDVGVDCWDFHPVSLEKIIEIMNRKKEMSKYTSQ